MHPRRQAMYEVLCVCACVCVCVCVCVCRIMEGHQVHASGHRIPLAPVRTPLIHHQMPSGRTYQHCHVTHAPSQWGTRTLSQGWSRCRSAGGTGGRGRRAPSTPRSADRTPRRRCRAGRGSSLHHRTRTRAHIWGHRGWWVVGVQGSRLLAREAGPTQAHSNDRHPTCCSRGSPQSTAQHPGRRCGRRRRCSWGAGCSGRAP